MEGVSLKTIKEARERIGKTVLQTPVLQSIYLESETGHNVQLKLENLNISGSFKIRGATNSLISAPKEELKKGIIAASAGNHAQGVAHVARILSAKSTIFMPESTPLIKVESTRNLGATVKLTGTLYDDAFAAAQAFQKKNGGIMVHAYADEKVICGQGTIGLELLEQVDNIGLILVPVGGGGLISGIACAVKTLKPDVKIIGVQTKAFPAMKLSFDAGKRVMCDPLVTIADGIAVKNVNDLNLSLILKYVDDIVLVDEEEIASAVMTLMERNHLLAEGAGAATVAALKKIDLRKFRLKNKSIVCIISGGNIDVNLLGRITSKGLIHSGRLMRLRFNIKDKPGCLAELLEVIGKTGSNIIDVRHHRTFSSAHYNEVEVHAEIETTNADHQESALLALTKAKFNFHRFED